MALAVATGVVAAAAIGLSVASRWSDLSQVDWRFSPFWLAVAVLATVGFLVVHGELAVLVLKRLGQDVPGGRMRVIYGLALLARYVPTGAAAVGVRLMQGEQIGVPKRTTTVALVYETLIAVSGAALVATISLFRVTPVLAWVSLACAVLLPIAALHPRLLGHGFERLLRRVGLDDLPSPMPAGTVLALTAFAALSFVLSGISLLALAKTMAAISFEDVPLIISAGGVAFLSAVVGFALPGGLGAREAGVVVVLSFAMPGSIAVAVAAASRLLQTALEIGYAGLAHAVVRRGSRSADVSGAELEL